MKLISVGVMISVLCLVSLAWAGEYNFRQTKWGMSKEEVKASENLKPSYEEDKWVSYETNILNHDVSLRYFFLDGKLYNASYNSDKSHKDPLSMYRDFKEMLREKYGPPIRVNEPEDWGKNTNTIQSEVSSEWETHRTGISCEIAKYGESLLTSVTYKHNKSDAEIIAEMEARFEKMTPGEKEAIRAQAERQAKAVFEKAKPLEVLEWHWYKERKRLIAVGQVKNKANATLKYVEALVTWYDKEGKLVTYATSLIEYTKLAPGQTSPFRVSCRYWPNVAKASLEFKELSGHKLSASFH